MVLLHGKGKYQVGRSKQTRQTGKVVAGIVYKLQFSGSERMKFSKLLAQFRWNIIKMSNEVEHSRRMAPHCANMKEGSKC